MIHTGIHMDYPPEIHQFVMENSPKKTFDDGTRLNIVSIVPSKLLNYPRVIHIDPIY